MNQNIGKIGTDKITGIFGVVTGRCEHLYGCTQVYIQPKAKENSKVEGIWVDEGRAEYGEIVFTPSDVEGERPGGPSRGPSIGNLRV